jgi:hypothetical protein
MAARGSAGGRGWPEVSVDGAQEVGQDVAVLLRAGRGEGRRGVRETGRQRDGGRRWVGEARRRR